MSPNLKYRPGQRQRKRESSWQASEAKREKERQGPRSEREIKSKGDTFLLEE